MDDMYRSIVLEIVQGQEQIIGPIAVEQASSINGITLNWDSKSVELSGDPKQIINNLIGSYKDLFGQISVEVCRQAAHKVSGKLSSDQLPSLLQ